MAEDENKKAKLREEIEKRISRLQKDRQNMYRSMLKDLDANNKSIEEFENLLEDVSDVLDKITGSLNYVHKSFMDSVNELKTQNEYLNKQRQALSKLSGIAQTLLDIRRGDSDYDKKKIEKLKEEAKRRIDILKTIRRQGGYQGDALRALNEEIKAAEELNDSFEGIGETFNDVNKKLGFIPKLAGGIDKAFSKIFGVSAGIDDAVKETQRLGQEAASTNDKGFKPMSTFIGIVGGKLKESLSLINLIQVGLIQIVSAFKSIDDGAGIMAKTMNVTYTEALALRKELTDIANASGDTNVNTQMLEDTLVSVNQLMGARVSLNEADLVTMAKMNKLAGISNEENLELLKLSTLNNQTVEKTNTEILGAAKAYAAKNKLAINEKQILKDVAKASTALKLSLGGGADKLAEAAVKARQFGLNLEQAEKMSESLLNFESSIENELSAELLTGKELNLEKARALSLSGDAAGAAAEMAKQVGTAAEFGEMNVIQQDALAKAVGMTREELAKSLVDREALTKLGAKEGQSAQDRYNELKKQGMSEAQIAAKLGSDEQARMFEQQNLQEQFNQTIEKLKEIFVTVGNALMPIFDVFSNIFSVVGPIVGAIGSIVSFMSPILKPLLLIYGAFKGISFITKGLTSLNKVLIAQNNIRTAQSQTQVAAETTKLGLGQRILAVLGLQDAMLVYQIAKEQGMNTLTALRLAMEETVLGTLVLQGINLLKNVGQYILLTIQAGFRAVAESTILGAIAAQKTGLIAAIAAGAIRLAQAIATSVAEISGSAAISLGVAAAIALAAGAAAYAFFGSIKANDMVSPGGGGGDGYGQRTLLGPEGAIRLNDKDTVIAGTNLFGDDIKSEPGKATETMGKGEMKVASKEAKSGGSTDMTQTNALLRELIAAVSTTGTVTLDGSKVGEALKIGSYKTQ